MTKRTEQDLLAERRATVLEQSRETDKTARELLQFSIDQIDRELHARRQAIPTIDASAVEATHKTIDDVVAERDARDALDSMFAQERALELVSVGGNWSPSHHVRAA